jgi:malonyl-CoA decarboxylase
VAHFHLGNGASIEQINWMGDKSPKGMRQSLGFMVNYLYVPAEIERNHEQYVKEGECAASDEVRGLLADLLEQKKVPAKSTVPARSRVQA